MYLSAGKTSDYIGAHALLDAQALRGRSRLCQIPVSQSIERSCYAAMQPIKKMPKTTASNNTDFQQKRHKVENMFA